MDMPSFTFDTDVFICFSRSKELRHTRSCFDSKAGAFECAALVTIDVTAFVIWTAVSRIEMHGKHVIGSLWSLDCIVMEIVGSERRGWAKVGQQRFLLSRLRSEAGGCLWVVT